MTCSSMSTWLPEERPCRLHSAANHSRLESHNPMGKAVVVEDVVKTLC